MTYAAMKFIVSWISVGSDDPSSFFVKAYATLAIINANDGTRQPASIQETIPIPSITLSQNLR